MPISPRPRAARARSGDAFPRPPGPGQHHLRLAPFPRTGPRRPHRRRGAAGAGVPRGGLEEASPLRLFGHLGGRRQAGDDVLERPGRLPAGARRRHRRGALAPPAGREIRRPRRLGRRPDLHPGDRRTARSTRSARAAPLVAASLEGGKELWRVQLDASKATIPFLRLHRLSPGLGRPGGAADRRRPAIRN